MKRKAFAGALAIVAIMGWFAWIQYWLARPFTDWRDDRVGFIEFGVDG